MTKNIVEDGVASIGGVLLLTTIISFPILMLLGYFQWARRHPVQGGIVEIALFIVLGSIPYRSAIFIEAFEGELIGIFFIYIIGLVAFFAGGRRSDLGIDESKLSGAVYRSYYWFVAAFSFYIPAAYAFYEPVGYPWTEVTIFCGMIALLLAAIGDVYVGLYMVRARTHGTVRELINKM